MVSSSRLRMRKLRVVLALLALSGAISGCNLYRLFDQPTNDAQRLSLARGCFDRGDFTCAAQQYALVSSLSADTSLSEGAWLILDQEGIGLPVMSQAILSSSSAAQVGGKFISQLAAVLTTKSPGVIKRKALHTAYLKAPSIGSGSLRGLVRLLTASAFMAELLAETAATSSQFVKADLAADGVPSCTTTAGACSITPVCTVPGGYRFNDGAAPFSLDTATTTDIDGTPSGIASLYMIDAAANAIATALSGSELGSTGSFGGGVSQLAAAIIAAGGQIGIAGLSGESPCYRAALLEAGVGN